MQPTTSRDPMVQLVRRLKEAAGPVSGEHLASAFSVTRSALQQRIERLRSRGFVIHGKRGSGYLLVSRPDRLLPENILPWLETKELGQALLCLDRCESTNDVAKALAAQGASHGTCVLAEAQTKGRGRQGRPWYSPPRRNLYVSIVLRPRLPLDRAPAITLASAVAAAEALEQVTGLSPVLKWPNDLLVGGKKLCGILTEMAADPDGIQWVVVGVGCNVNTAGFPDWLAGIATSCALELEREVFRPDLLVRLLHTMETWFQRLIAEGVAPVLEAWQAHPNILGRRVSVHVPGEPEPLVGIAQALSEEGCLVLRVPDGSDRIVLAGDVMLEH